MCTWWLYVCSFLYLCVFICPDCTSSHTLFPPVSQTPPDCNTLTHLREKNNDPCHTHTHSLSLSLTDNCLFWGYLVGKKYILDLNFFVSRLLHPVLFCFSFTDFEELCPSLCTMCVSKGFTLSPYCYLNPVITLTHVRQSVPPSPHLIFSSCPDSPCACKGESKECFQQTLFL